MGDGLDDAARLKADRQLVEFLAAKGFGGPAYHAFANEMARYGIAVLQAWLRSGLIFVKCAEVGIRLPPPLDWSREDQFELTLETVARAMNRLHRHLVAGKWDADRGAGLKTYFIRGCVYQFTEPYRAWHRSLDQWDQRPAEPDERLMESSPGPEEIAVIRDQARQALRNLGDARLQAVVVLAADGYEYAEIAEVLGDGTTARSVEGLLYRHRRRAKGGNPS
ncbi:RNA polymerase sigma factor [Actinomadura sp. 21ATH]|uniref:RNA polymerase sigma factor n=1 Tax=Actinomadura sp. 21ATH TaxID=1735444 RepID=UPI0035C1CD2F